jgi:hypothetical protein
MPTISDRRSWVQTHARVPRLASRAALLVLATVAVLLWPPPPAPAQSFVPAHSARAFGDSIGVNVRLTWLDSSYGDFGTLSARLRELGVRHVSDGLCPTCEYQIDRLRRLAGVGIKANLGIGSLGEGTGSIAPGLQAVRTRLRDSVASLSGVNEPDISGDPDWISHTRAFQTELYRQAKADPFLASLPVLAPSLVNRESRTALGDLSAYADRGNLHPYPGGAPPLRNLLDEQQLAAHVTGTKPLVISEVGYHTDMAHVGPHRPASERAVAIYTPRIALEAFSFGIERTYIFQLADPWSPTAAQSRGVPASENSFGLLRSNLSPKPAFYTLRNLLRAVDGGSAPLASPGGLRMALDGAAPDVRMLLLRSASGSFALVLWRDVSVWDRDTQTDVSPPADRLDVVFGEPVAVAQRFDPVLSDAETQRWTNPGRIGIDLGGAPVVLRLTPPAAVAGTAPRGGSGSCAATPRRPAGKKRARPKGRGKKHARPKGRGKKHARPKARCCGKQRARAKARCCGRKRARAKARCCARKRGRAKVRCCAAKRPKAKGRKKGARADERAPARSRCVRPRRK